MDDSKRTVDPTLEALLGAHDGGRVDVELFVRSLAPFPDRRTQERLVDRLETLRTDGVLDTLSIRVWGDAVRTDGAIARAGDGETAVDRVTEFFARAAESSWSVSRYFRVVSGTTATEGETDRRIALPRRCLAVRRSGELLGVFPCDLEGTRYTPEDALAYLESDRDGTRVSYSAQ